MSERGLAPPARRRLYLMRHGSVAYFPAGAAPADMHAVELSEAGRAQADAAGRLFAAAGVRFDRVIATGLPRTRQTAERVLAHQPGGQAGCPAIEHWPALRELESGDLDATLDPARDACALREAFCAPFEGEPDRATRFRGGESVGELLERVVPAIEQLAADPHWRVALVVAHGGVNRAVLSYALAGARTFLAGFQQAPACINAIDVAATRERWLVRLVNHAPYDALQADARDSTMEALFAQYLNHRRR